MANTKKVAGGKDKAAVRDKGPALTKVPAKITLYWIHPVYDDGTMNAPVIYGFPLVPTEEGFFCATMDPESARAELMRKHRRIFMSEKDYKFLLRTRKDGEKKK